MNPFSNLKLNSDGNNNFGHDLNILPFVKDNIPVFFKLVIDSDDYLTSSTTGLIDNKDNGTDMQASGINSDSEYNDKFLDSVDTESPSNFTKGLQELGKDVEVSIAMCYC